MIEFSIEILKSLSQRSIELTINSMIARIQSEPSAHPQLITPSDQNHPQGLVHPHKRC